MKHIGTLLTFWYDFVVGDDWVVAAGVVACTHASTVTAVVRLSEAVEDMSTKSFTPSKLNP